MTALQCAIGGWLVVAATGCMLLPRSRDASLEPRSQAHEDPTADTASHDGDDLSGEPLVLESRLQVRRMRNGQTLTLELEDGDIVMDGDRLQAYIRTAQAAHAYLAFCSQSASDPRHPGIRIFPEIGAIRIPARTTTIVPHKAAEVVLDTSPGPEALYLIVSRVELSRDSELPSAIAAARSGNETSDCRSPKPDNASPQRELRGKLPVRIGNRASASPGPRPRPATAPPEEPEPRVEIQRGERGANIIWNQGMLGSQASPDSLVVLRYGLRHIAAP